MPNKIDYFAKTSLLLICFLLAFVNIGSLFIRSSTYTDFFAWWFASQYVRQNIDPYTEFTDHLSEIRHIDFSSYVQAYDLSFPISYLDGDTDTRRSLVELSTTKQVRPSNTAPMILLITLFSQFSWPVASQLWFLSNLLFLLGIIYVTFHYVAHSEYNLSLFTKLLIVFAFLGLDATRSALQQGQTVILVVFLGMLTLYLIDRDHKILAGVALGIAVSKFNVILPTIFLFLLYRRQFKVIIGSALTQISALVLLGLLTQTNILYIFLSYADIAFITGDSGRASQLAIHLGSYFTPSGWNTLLSTGLLSLLIIGYLIYILQKSKANTFTNPRIERLLDIHILSVLSLMSLLTIHHIKYDILSIFICMFVFALPITINRDKKWEWLRFKSRWISLFVIILFLPLYISYPISFWVDDILLARLIFSTQTLSIIIMMVITIIMLKALLRYNATSEILDENL